LDPEIRPEFSTFKGSPTVDDILATHERLKGLGIEPVLTAHYRLRTAFYYEDPDRNSVELTVDEGTGRSRAPTCGSRQSSGPT
jgi:hypothetical protein